MTMCQLSHVAKDLLVYLLIAKCVKSTAVVQNLRMQGGPSEDIEEEEGKPLNDAKPEAPSLLSSSPLPLSRYLFASSHQLITIYSRTRKWLVHTAID